MTIRHSAPLLAAVLLVLFVQPLEAQRGDLRVTVAATGVTDEARYVVSLDLQSQPVGVNGSVVFERVPAGSHTVTLLDLPEGCTVRGQNPREAVVVAGQTVEAKFAVECGLALPEARDAQRDTRRERAEVAVPAERESQRGQEATQLEVAAPVEAVLVEEYASEAISGFAVFADNGPPFFGTEPPGKVIARLRVPTGNFVLSAKLAYFVRTRRGGSLSCRLIAGADADEARAYWVTPSLLDNIGGVLALEAVHEFTLPGEVLLQCSGTVGGEYDAEFVAGLNHIRITAIKVGKLTNQPLEIVD